MIYLKDNQFKFYKHLITFTEDGEPKSSYENDYSSVMEMVYNNPRKFKNFSIDFVVPTKEQVDRLNEINAISLEFKENYVQDLSTYVKDGVMFNRDPNLMGLVEKTKAKTIEFLVDNAKPYVKLLRDEKCDGGIDLFGFKFDSNKMARSNVSQYILIALKEKLLSKGDYDAPNRTYVWKDFNDIYRSLSFEQVLQLADHMAAHMQACFTGENLTLIKLSKLSIDELLKFPINRKYNRIGKNVAIEEDLTINKLPVDEAECPLKKIYEESYMEAMAALIAQG